MLMDLFGLVYFCGDYQQLIGFVSVLSQVIIWEDNVDDDGEVYFDELLDDEFFEFVGFLWIKEGIVSYKYFKDGNNKKFKNYNWIEVFVVI